MLFTIHSLDAIEGSHDIAPLIIYPKPSWISISLPFARLSCHVWHVMFVLLHLLLQYVVVWLERCRVGNHWVFLFMSVEMTSYGTSATYWGMMSDLGFQEIITVTGGCLKRGARVAVHRMDGIMYVLMEKSDWLSQSALGSSRSRTRIGRSTNCGRTPLSARS